MIDSAWKNISAYLGFFALAVLVGALESVHLQYQARHYVDVWDTVDAVIAYVLPSLVLMLGAMKLTSVGHEPLAEKVAEHEERLKLDDPVALAPPEPDRVRVIPATAPVEASGRG